MTAPRIGEMVHYRIYPSQDARVNSRCVPACVTEIHDGEEVGLLIAMPLSLQFDRNVRHDEEQDNATWHWPCDTRKEEEG